MTEVGKEPDELHTVIQGFQFGGLSAFHLDDQAFQHAEYAQDDLVPVLEDC